MKEPKKIWVSEPFFSTYDSFSDLLALCKVLQDKSNDDILRWDFAHTYV